MAQLFAEHVPERTRVVVTPGAVWLKQWLSIEQQRALVGRCCELMDGPAGGYTPTVRGGGRMRVRMMCLGRHWNPLTYTYTSTRADHDDAPVAAVPGEWIELASSAAADADVVRSERPYRPDICLINFYAADGRMGLHQDKDESAASLEAGHPWSRSPSATRSGFCSVDRSGASRSRASSSNPATFSSSAVPHACATTACRASSRRRRRPHSASTGAST
jgi:alkylated DNA repair dioxygenase AlkB